MTRQFESDPCSSVTSSTLLGCFARAVKRSEQLRDRHGTELAAARDAGCHKSDTLSASQEWMGRVACTCSGGDTYHASHRSCRLQSIASVKFLHPVLPDDVVELEIRISPVAAAEHRAHFRGVRASTAVVEGVFTLRDEASS